MGGFCFVSGTLVTMGDGAQEVIQDIEVGDIVKSWNEITNKVENSKVVKLIQPVHDDMLIIRFSNGVVNENTFDHPYYVKDKGWCSYSPNLTKERYDINTESLEIGDVCYFNNNGELAYSGAIDDNPKDAKKVKRNYLADAINAISNGKRVKIKTTKALGCSIKF